MKEYDNYKLLKLEKRITKLSMVLLAFFLILLHPSLLGASALIGVVMSLGLYLFPRIRKWERS